MEMAGYMDIRAISVITPWPAIHTANNETAFLGLFRWLCVGSVDSANTLGLQDLPMSLHCLCFQGFLIDPYLQ